MADETPDDTPADARTFLDGGPPDLPELIEQPKNKGGRPTLYTEALGEQYCEKIAGGLKPWQVSDLEGFPSYSTFFRWLNQYPEFKRNYVMARLWYLDRKSSLIVAVAADNANDYKIDQPENGMPIAVVNREVIARSALHVKALEAELGREWPRKYGSKADGAGMFGLLATEFVPTDLIPPPPPEPEKGAPGDNAKLVNGREPITIDNEPVKPSLDAYGKAIVEFDQKAKAAQ